MAKVQLREFYDTIVIGAGIGGLTTASLLAARGKDVLVLEHHYLPGGSAQTFTHKGYKFDVGPKLFFGMDPRGRGNMRYHQDVFDEIGEHPDLTLYDSYYTFIHPEGKLLVDGDVEGYVEKLCAQFPASSYGIRAFYRQLEEIHEIFVSFPNFPLDAPEAILEHALKVNPLKWMRLLYWMNVSLGALFDIYIADKRLRAIVNAEFAAFCYVDIDEAPAVLAALVLIERHKGGGVFTKGGSMELARLLARGLEKHGGTLAMRQRVKRVVVENGAAVGVELEKGGIIRANHVISNAGVVNTFGKEGTSVEPLVDREVLTPATRRKVDGVKMTDSFFTIFAGVDARVIPPDTDPHVMFMDEYYPNKDEMRMICFCNSSLRDPSLAPPGKMAIQVVYFSPETGKFKSWERDADYEARKERHFHEAMAMADRVFPGFSEAIDYYCIGTPLTYRDYLAKEGGNWGIAMSIDQFAFRRFQHKTDVKNLYLVGCDTHPGSGVIGVTMSGINCAYHIAKPGKK